MELLNSLFFNLAASSNKELAIQNLEDSHINPVEDSRRSSIFDEGHLPSLFSSIQKPDSEVLKEIIEQIKNMKEEPIMNQEHTIMSKGELKRISNEVRSNPIAAKE